MLATTHRKYFATLFCAMLLPLGVPFISHADTMSDLRSQVDSLLRLVTLLQGKLQDALASQSVQDGSLAPLVASEDADPFSDISGTPTCTMTVSPTTITAGQSAVLSWTSENATQASISAFGGSFPTSMQSVTPLETTLYFGTFAGPVGSVVCTALIHVTPATSTALFGEFSSTTAPAPYFCPAGIYGYWSFAFCPVSQDTF